MKKRFLALERRAQAWKNDFLL